MALLGKFKSRKKGFFSIDALFAIILLLLIISTLLNLYRGREQMAEGSRAKMEGKMVSSKLAGAINIVHGSGTPLALSLNLPDNILGKDYSLRFDPESREISVKIGGSSTSFTNSSVVVEELNLENLNTSQRIKIYWSNGTIRVKNP